MAIKLQFYDGLQDKSIEYDLSFVQYDSIGNGMTIPSGPWAKF